ncbi:unnamed protein product [Trichobilharzia regenti]|nr:unnamed protein product [Trichobilharzia regenti]
MPRPSCTEPTYDLSIEVTSNLKTALEKLSLDPSFKPLGKSSEETNTGNLSIYFPLLFDSIYFW